MSMQKAREIMHKDDMRLSDGRVLNDYSAVAIAEGFDLLEYQENESDILLAWSYIGKRRLYMHLQGFFGRGLSSLINAGKLDNCFNVIG